MSINFADTKKLLSEWDYKPNQIEDVVNRLLSMDVDILTAFDHWLQTSDFSASPMYSKFSPKSLHEIFPFLKPPAVFLLLDWIRREPKQALFAMEQEFGKPSLSNL
jgi:hypothetical protein